MTRLGHQTGDVHTTLSHLETKPAAQRGRVQRSWCRCAAHGKVDPNGVVLPVDTVDDVVQQVSDGGLLQGHGWRQAAADQSGPHLAHIVPVPGAGVQSAAVEGQQAVEGALRERVNLSGAQLA